ncbi:MAG: prephenate dehydrogenase/arogenate dehydrogenase family protein [Spirochaetaceae bacterium]|nr:MAG: prephenate dehydrogenase/arogenate dehydrogenase family protein [Spirochaetaceae bacterium]
MKVGVFGLGRFGALWAQLLASRVTVLGFNRSPGRRIPDGVRVVGFDDLAGCDALFLCVSISAMEDAVERVSSIARPGMLVLDTCSVKEYPLAVMRSRLPSEVHLIGTHPMFGPDSTHNGVADLPLIVCRERAPEALVRFWIDLFEGLGLKVLEMSAAEHDQEAAYTQGITHFIGRVLRELDVCPSEIATLGYRKILDVVEQTCNDPLQLFLDLQRYNRFTAEMRRELEAAFDRVVERLGPQAAAEWSGPEGNRDLDIERSGTIG